MATLSFPFKWFEVENTILIDEVEPQKNTRTYVLLSQSDVANRQKACNTHHTMDKYMKIKQKEDQIVDPSVLSRREKIIMGARRGKLVGRGEAEGERGAGYNSQTN